MANTVFKPGNWFSNARKVLGALQFSTENGVIGGQVTTYTSDGAISLNDSFAILNAASATTQMTLAAGNVEGQEITIYALDVTNTCDVDVSGGTPYTITYTSAGETSVLRWSGTDWIGIVNTGAIT